MAAPASIGAPRIAPPPPPPAPDRHYAPPAPQFLGLVVAPYLAIRWFVTKDGDW